MESRVQPPAICLMVMGALGLLLELTSLAANSFNLLFSSAPMLNSGHSGQGPEVLINAMSGGVGMAIAAIGVAANGFVLFGGWKMYRMESYNLAIAAAGIACVPCFNCCCISVPFGIWALVILLDQQVKDGFTSA